MDENTDAFPKKRFNRIKFFRIICKYQPDLLFLQQNITAISHSFSNCQLLLFPTGSNFGKTALHLLITKTIMKENSNRGADMIKRKIDIHISDYPAELHGILLSGNIYDSSCSPSARTLYCDTGYYIKIHDKGALAMEADFTKLFYRIGLGVEVVSYLSADRDYLVIRNAVGEDLTHHLNDPKKLCEILAAALRKLHSQPIAGVPVSLRLQQYLDSANGDFSGGNYDESVLMDQFRIHSKQEAWNIMQANKDQLSADTLIHADACLPNIICHNGSFSSFIDLGMAGVGDKHIDLYWAIWSLQYNLKTDEYTDYFLDQYGRDNFDYHMLKVIAAYELFG
jgi:kanamycin kinase